MLWASVEPVTAEDELTSYINTDNNKPAPKTYSGKHECVEYFSPSDHELLWDGISNGADPDTQTMEASGGTAFPCVPN